jgi:hypothetical protein
MREGNVRHGEGQQLSNQRLIEHLEGPRICLVHIGGLMVPAASQQSVSLVVHGRTNGDRSEIGLSLFFYLVTRRAR